MDMWMVCVLGKKRKRGHQRGRCRVFDNICLLRLILLWAHAEGSLAGKGTEAWELENISYSRLSLNLLLLVADSPNIDFSARVSVILGIS
jgi:hypothetical protein